MGVSLSLASLGATIALGALSGCGGNVFVDQSGGGGSGSTESSTANGSTGSSKPSSGSGDSHPGFACQVSQGGLSTCIYYPVVPGGLGDALDMACSSSNGHTVDACSSDGVVGCCSQSEAGFEFVACYYGTEITRSLVEQSCQASSGKFTTSPP